ncbi:long-chain-fatty-acid--CoA ligase ACSBG2-like isoform X1 [Frieseomelitta varia]|uniref:long-chain-fatty-acid--CoA ligase ACSBG2-like isoform X1 n=2 Tax=Frieseomelitta varia TaxID=561572 RepID=UPI001CB67F99|nr:long-chain-fatty-acid--CoA ligase ACSBG2-like isoform X1 [Frieseomelitta varia]XP_043528279.1 long-chain-fatty-acid--CoA ligase ACSBG2-like isoform X1 [Frieseomelitta varia]
MTTIQTNGSVNRFTNSKDVTNNVSYYANSETDLDGPDQILAADSFTTTKMDECVRIQLSNDNLKPISVPGLLSRMAKKYPNHIALVARPDKTGRRKTYTFSEYENQVRIVAKGFLKLGLERFHGVCILGFNSPEWFFSDLGAIYAGGLAVGIYTTNNPEACQYCLELSRANIVVVEDSKQLEKILQIRHNLPHLKAIIQYDGTPNQKDVLSWNDLIKIGEAESDDKLNEVLKRIAVNQCCTLVFTSGTVGNPKAVMLSHDNLIQNAQAMTKMFKMKEASHSLISYLPLSHVAAQVIDIYCMILVAATLYFADKDALKGTLINTMLVVRPTIFIGVPRVWEKIYDKMKEIASNNGFIKTWIASWAKSHGLYYNMNKMNGNNYKHWGYIFAKWLILNKIKTALGLDRCTYCITAAAPLNNEIKEYFLSIDIIILDVFGMSECGGGHTVSLPDEFRLGSIGQTCHGFKTKVNNPDSNGEGEICIYGRHVFMGYLNLPEKTAEALDAEAWLHSGDIGKIDSDGYVYITGRIKELIITAGGENIPPVHIEQLILAELPALSNAILIGDKRKYLTILVTLKTKINNETGEPTDDFTVNILKWLQSIGSTSKTVSDVLKTHDSLVYEEIDKAIKRYNNKAISNAQKIQKFKILPKDFSVATGELGPTLKLKRNVVHKKYENLIEDMYK